MRATLHCIVFEIEILESSSGFAALRVSGRRCTALFRDEPGGHRWQRVPPNERHGRVHTSTITVAILPEPSELELKLDPHDLIWKMSRGSGAGGQHRNKTESAVDLTHRPTGITVHCESERSQHDNKRFALGRLRARILEERRTAEAERARLSRKAQVGQGMRGDKRRTIRCQDGIVVDHPTGRTWRLRDYLKGQIH